MNELTKIQADIVAFAIVALLLFGCYCTFCAMRWALGEAIDCEIDAHSAVAFPEFTQQDYSLKMIK